MLPLQVKRMPSILSPRRLPEESGEGEGEEGEGEGEEEEEEEEAHVQPQQSGWVRARAPVLVVGSGRW